jgi:hypothetical protein
VVLVLNAVVFMAFPSSRRILRLRWSSSWPLDGAEVEMVAAAKVSLLWGGNFNSRCFEQTSSFGSTELTDPASLGLRAPYLFDGDAQLGDSS